MSLGSSVRFCAQLCVLSGRFTFPHNSGSTTARGEVTSRLLNQSLTDSAIGSPVASWLERLQVSYINCHR